MSTNRTRRTRQAGPFLRAAEIAYLSDDPKALAAGNHWDRYLYGCLRAGSRNGHPEGLPPDELWESYRDDFLPDFIRANPCKRPLPWWHWEAPEQRARLGGQGRPHHEVLAYVESFKYGIPDSWVTRAELWAFSSLKESDAIDPDDPPTFESEAVYLERHGLLTEGEKRWLKQHPEALQPEVIAPH